MRDYNWASQYDRNRVKRETRVIVSETTVPVGSGLTYEEYCAALGVSVTAARGASCIGALASYMADDPIGRALAGQ